MPVLCWDKPEQIMSKDEWASMVFDGGPPGSYVPNMSSEDRAKWKAKFIGGKYARVEIRKTFTEVQHVQTLVIVSLSGAPMGKRGWSGEKKDFGEELNLKISMNGSAHLTFEDFESLRKAVDEARAVLENKS